MNTLLAMEAKQISIDFRTYFLRTTGQHERHTARSSTANQPSPDIERAPR
ncbi:hypothetical protein CCP4SC76_2100014 [Gammaproteobacteria bacterium]